MPTLATLSHSSIWGRSRIYISWYESKKTKWWISTTCSWTRYGLHLWSPESTALFLKLNTTIFFQPIEDILPAFGVHATMIDLLKCSWNKGQRQWISYLMNFARNNKEPLFAPFSLALIMLVTKRTIVEVFWKWRKIANTASFKSNGFLGLSNEHIEVNIQWHLNAMVVLLQRDWEKDSNWIKN